MSAPLALHSMVRYEPVLRLVRELGGGELLEVGSAHAGLRGHGLRERRWRVTALDRSFDNYGQAAGEAPAGSRVVVGDARDLPFGDRSFDVVVALDLLEHVPPADRSRVLAELARVTRRRAIVGCPAGAGAREADRRLAASFSRRGRKAPVWLDEHFANGFPEPGDLEAGLSAAGSVRLLANESAAAHLRLMFLHYGLGWSAPVRALTALLATGLRPHGLVPALARRALALVRGRDRLPSYRTIAVLDVGR